MKTLLILAWLFVIEEISTTDVYGTWSSKINEAFSASTTNGTTTNGGQSSSIPTATTTQMQPQGNGTSTEGSGSASVQFWMPSLFIVLLVSKFSVLVAC